MRRLLVVLLACLLACTSARAQAEREFELGSALVQEGKYEEALPHLEEAVRLAPDFAPPYNGRALVQESRGETERALADYGACLERDPTFWKAWMNRGSLLSRLGRSTEAERDLDRAIELAPDESPPLIARGHHRFMSQGRPDLALEDFDAAKPLGELDLGTRSNRARALAALGEREAALAEFEQLLAAEPKEPLVRANRALALESLGRYEEALRDWQVALEAKSLPAALRTNLLQLHLVRGETTEAAEIFESLQAEALPPEYAAHLAVIEAELLLAQGRGAEAVPLLRRALERQPWRATLRALLVRGLAIAGDRAEARKQGRHALREWPGTQLSGDARAVPPDVRDRIIARVAATPDMQRQKVRLLRDLASVEEDPARARRLQQEARSILEGLPPEVRKAEGRFAAARL